MKRHVKDSDPSSEVMGREISWVEGRSRATNFALSTDLFWLPSTTFQNQAAPFSLSEFALSSESLSFHENCQRTWWWATAPATWCLNCGHWIRSAQCSGMSISTWDPCGVTSNTMALVPGPALIVVWTTSVQLSCMASKTGKSPAPPAVPTADSEWQDAVGEDKLQVCPDWECGVLPTIVSQHHVPRVLWALIWTIPDFWNRGRPTLYWLWRTAQS